LRPIASHRAQRFALEILALIAIAAPTLARADNVVPRDFASYRPSAAATRISASEAPKIDGDLSDAVWNKAPAIDEFYQLEPHEGQPGSEKTVVRVLYDENNFYFALRAYDDPSKVTAKIKVRDGAIDDDDIFRIYLDPNMTRRDAYIFEVNPLGARREGLIQNNSTVLYEWNTLWDAKAKMLSDGWAVEVSIPFRSLSYQRGRKDWGFDLFRLIRRKNERIRWSSIDIRIPSPDVSRSGTLTGIENPAEGLGIEAKVFGAFRYRREWSNSDADAEFRPSGNFYYKLTPDLTGTFTFNTDFSDAPLDARQVNITRFALFYPETRDFFLQDAAAFEFGGNNMNNDPNARPFFSRNIGLVNGIATDLDEGLKLSGEFGGFDIGALSVKTSNSSAAPGQILSAVRVTTPVLDESKIGIIYTNGDPTGLTNNQVGGADFQYRNSHVLGSNTLQGDFYYERSQSNLLGADDSWGFNINYPNEPWNADFRFKQVGDNFAPALGFVSRPGIREYNGQIVNRTRFADGDVRWVEVGTWWDIFTGLDNNLQSRFNGAWTGAYTNAGDFFLAETWSDTEKVSAPFSLPGNLVVPAGDYTFEVFHARTETSLSRPVALIFDVQCCGFFNGSLLQTDATLDIRPNSTFSFKLRHIMDALDLPTGHTVIHIGSLDAGVNFTPDMQLLAQAQYDNVSDQFGLSLRYRWEFAPGSELLVAAGDDATINGGYFSHESALSIRLGHTIRL
jgi:hypothetical protein